MLQAHVVQALRVVLIATLLGVPAASAQPTSRQDAAAHFSRGEAAQAQGRYRDAIAEYEQAYAIAPHPNALYNIAVCYEALEDHAAAAEHYQRYLDEVGPAANDADTVRAKIRDLRAKLPATEPEPQPAPEPAPPPVDSPRADPWPTERPGVADQVPAPPVVRPGPKWTAGLSYGVGFGDVPVQRFAVSGARRFAGRLELGAVLGLFGKNDKGLGVTGRLVLARSRFQPFVRGAVTIGYAKQDASSSAETRFPLGLEAGGGVQLGKRGRVELGLVVRWLRGGFDAASTTADSFVNDGVAIAVDLGVALDFPIAFPSARR